MGVDTYMWLQLKADEKTARKIMIEFVGGWDTTLDMLREWKGGCLYGASFTMHVPVQYDRWDGRWAVSIEAHTGKGTIPFEETARHLLEQYPDCELEGVISNDCFQMYEYDRFDAYNQCYEFHVYPGDWESFLKGDYRNTTQGRNVDAARCVHPKGSILDVPDSIQEINDPMPF